MKPRGIRLIVLTVTLAVMLSSCNFLTKCKPESGENGKSAYELAQEQGFDGTLEEWLLSLKGEKGDQGIQGEKGDQGEQGIQGEKGDQGEQGIQGEKGDQGEQGIQGEKGDQGELGSTIELRMYENQIQWKYTNEPDTAWRTLMEDIAPEGVVTLTLVTYGGTLDGVDNEIYVTAGTSIDLPVPTQSGYIFKGWYADENDTDAISSPYRVQESHTLYAKWEEELAIDGTPIYTWNDFLKIKNDLAGTYVLMNDIDCEGMALPMMGESAEFAFTGRFEGQGYTISNYVVPTNGNYIGFIAYNAGVIRNLNLTDFHFSIQNLSVSDSIYVGGITGFNAGTIEQCSVTQASISVKLDNARCAGLIAGCSTGIVTNCIAKGTVSVRPDRGFQGNRAWAGGVTGSTRGGTISNCYVDAIVEAYDSSYTSARGQAALVTGANDGLVSNCLVLGSVTEGNCAVGDIAINVKGTVKSCFKASTVSLATNSGAIQINATEQSLENLSKSAFYEISLEWDPAIWNFEILDLSVGVHPTLKQND